MQGIRLLLRHLLLVAALLGYAAAASAHDHDAPARPGDGLCAICVYGGASLGGVATPQSLPAVPFLHLPPVSLGYRCATAPAPTATRIRGPPSSL